MSELVIKTRHNFHVRPERYPLFKYTSLYFVISTTAYLKMLQPILKV